MTYTLPFQPNQRLVELGGGQNRKLAPPAINVDIRPGLGVDVVADLNEKLPFEDEAFDGVLSIYSLEHCNWRNIRQACKEIGRITARGGVAVIVTANFRAQAEFVLKAEEWDERQSQTVFGDHDYSTNAHATALDPVFIQKLMREAGFQDVTVIPHGEFQTDMIVEARKFEPHVHSEVQNWTDEERKRAYDQGYYNGHGKYGGYA